MATDDLDDARVLASLSRILNDGAPYVALPGVDPATFLPPAPMVEAFRTELVDTGRLSEANLSGTFAPVTLRRDIREFLVDGETLDPTGTVDMAAIHQRAITACGDAYDAQTGAKRGIQIVWPAGRFRIGSRGIWRSGVGLAGAGAQYTQFLPEGNAVVVYGNQSGTPTVWFEDCVFSDFQIDAAAQTGTAGDSSIKGIFMQFLRRFRAERVIVRNTWMTGFGLDYFSDEPSVMIDCQAYGCGRSAPNTEGAGAGFGIATGYSTVETLSIINCVSRDNGTHGFFTENKWDGVAVLPYPVAWSRGFSLIGCVASGNQSGFCDAGSEGALVDGCQFYDNARYGVLLGQTPANSSGGINGRITRCMIFDNNDGIGIARMQVGGYEIEGNSIYGNRYGIVRSTPGGATSNIPGAIKIRRNDIFDNTGAGIRIPSAGSLYRLTIRDNDFRDNGTDTALTDRDGITIYAPLSLPDIQSNRFWNTAVGGMVRAIWLRGTETTTQPIIRGNECEGIGNVSPYTFSHTIASSTYVTDNITRDGSVAVGGAWSDAFSRADGALGGSSTETGEQVWELGGTGTVGSIVSGRAKISAVTSGNAMAYVNSGASDGTFTATLAESGTDKTGRLIFRGTALDSFLALQRISSGDKSWRFVRVASGATTDIHAPAGGVPIADGDVIEVILAGTTVTININSVLFYTGTVTQLETGTRFGFLATSTSLDMEWDTMSLAT